MRFAIVMLASLGLLLGASIGMADDKDKKPPPPPKGTECSPGYWKNHTEDWVGIACTGEACDQLLSDLSARGPGSSDIRAAAAAFIEGEVGATCLDD